MSNKNKNAKSVKYSNNGKGGAAQSKARVWIIGVAVALVVIIAISFGIAFGGSTKRGKQNAAGDLVIPLSQITKNVKIYTVTVEGKKMEVIAARTSGGDIRTAFNTCQVCHDSGKGYYKASGKTVTCQNCGYKYTVDEFSTAQGGGCKPWAISASNRTVSGDNLIISYSYLRSQKNLF